MKSVYSRFITRAEMANALRTIREDAHYDYLLSEGDKSERASEREDLCNKLAELLDLDLGPVER